MDAGSKEYPTMARLNGADVSPGFVGRNVMLVNVFKNEPKQYIYDTHVA